MTFWAYAICGSIVLMTAAIWSYGDLENPSGIALLLVTPLCALYPVLVTLGVWRSAGRYQGDRRLAWAARGVMVIYAVMSIVSYGTMAYIGLLFVDVMVHPPFIR